MDDSALPVPLFDDDALGALAEDVAGAQADVEADAPSARMPDHLRRTLMGLSASWSEVGGTVDDGSAPAPSPRVLASIDPRGPVRARRWVAAAAVLLGLIAAAPFVLRGSRAEAGFSTTFVRRMDWASSVRRMPQGEAARFLAVGSRLAAGTTEWMGIGLPGASLVVVDAGAPLSVAPWPAKGAGGIGSFPFVGDRRAVFAASSGVVRMSAVDRAIPLDVNGVGLLMLVRGAAVVVVDAGVAPANGVGLARVAPGTPLVGLAAGSEALWRPVGSDLVHPLRAGERSLLGADGPRPFGEAEASLFRELRYFGGDVPAAPLERRVTARAWRLVRGAARPDGARREIAAGGLAAWSWPVPGALAGSDLVRLDATAGPGARFVLPQLGLVAECIDGPCEPGVAPLELELPEGWHDRLAGRPLELVLEAGRGHHAVVESLVFRQPVEQPADGARTPSVEQSPSSEESPR